STTRGWGPIGAAPPAPVVPPAPTPPPFPADAPPVPPAPAVSPAAPAAPPGPPSPAVAPPRPAVPAPPVPWALVPFVAEHAAMRTATNDRRIICLSIPPARPADQSRSPSRGRRRPWSVRVQYQRAKAVCRTILAWLAGLPGVRVLGVGTRVVV